MPIRPRLRAPDKGLGWGHLVAKSLGRRGYVGYCPHTVTVYNRATIKVLIYLYYEYYPTVTEWGHVPKVYHSRV